MLNSDGTLREEQVEGWGAAIRDSRGDIVEVSHGSSELQNINHFELVTMEKGIQLTIEKGCARLTLQSDSKNAIGYINGSEIPWKMRLITKRIRRMIGTVQDFRAVHIYWESNLLADRIAAMHPMEQWRELHIHNCTPT